MINNIDSVYDRNGLDITYLNEGSRGDVDDDEAFRGKRLSDVRKGRREYKLGFRQNYQIVLLSLFIYFSLQYCLYMRLKRM